MIFLPTAFPKKCPERIPMVFLLFAAGQRCG
jgi:hypothetical protein